MKHNVLHAHLLLLCPILCDPMDCSPPGFSVHGILQARILEWVAMPCLSLRDLPNPDIKPKSLTLQAYSLLSEPPGKPTRLGGDQENLVHCTKAHLSMFDIPCCASKRQLEPNISKTELPLPQTYLPQAFPEPAHCTSIHQFISLRT